MNAFFALLLGRSAFSNDTTSLTSKQLRSKRLLPGLLAIAICILFFQYDAAAQPGNLTYFFNTVMNNAGVDADARGKISSTLSRNRSGENQRIKVILARLDPNTAYQLNAYVGNDNTPTLVTEFSTDGRGAFVVTYARNRLGSTPRGSEPLPAMLDPLCNVRELEVIDGSGQAVLHAAPSVSRGRRYVVSRPLDNSGLISTAAGTLRIRGTTGGSSLKLLASGLAPNTDYYLFVNGGEPQVLTANASGKVKLASLPNGISNPLDIQSLSLADGDGNTVLSAGGIGLPCGPRPEESDTTPPSVISIHPLDGATDVPVSQNISVTFDEAMNASTISESTVTLRRGTTPVAGSVSYAGTTATFAQSVNLAPNTVYTVSISTGAQDLAGNALAADYIWSFTTAPTPAGQLPVALGSASGFAVLAGSAVTSSSFTVINNGDVGVSPGTAVDGFPPAAINNGTIHSANTTAAQAKLDLTTAYNDAAGRTVGAVILAGNLGGQTLPPGLYKSTSSLEISSGDLTLDAQGDANAVFIFQIASTLTTSSDRKVLLTGNAKAANVFWQVGTSATLGTLSVFKGTIMADQSITLTTGSALEGRALARIAGVTLGAATVTIPAP